MGAGEFDARRTIDEDRLADHRRVEPAIAIAIGFADDLRISGGEPAGKEGCYIRNLPGQQVSPDDERGLGAVHHAGILALSPEPS